MLFTYDVIKKNDTSFCGFLKQNKQKIAKLIKQANPNNGTFYKIPGHYFSPLSRSSRLEKVYCHKQENPRTTQQLNLIYFRWDPGMKNGY